MSEEVKKPHPMSKEGRALREQEKNQGSSNDLANQKPKESDAVLQEKLATVIATTNPAPETTKSEGLNGFSGHADPVGLRIDTEPTVPMSAVQDMVKSMVAEALKNNPPAPSVIQQVQVPPVQQHFLKKEFDIDDIPEFKNWEVKDREYEYMDGKPISASIPTKHSDHLSLQYYNKETNTTHALRYSDNQPSFLQERQSTLPGSVKLPEIIFSYGRLKVPKENVNLQKFLHIHPYKDVIFKEYDPTAKSREVIGKKRLKNEAERLVWEVGEITNRAIASLVCPSYVESWIPELLEEEILAYAEREPQKYIDFTNDPTIKMKGVVKSALFCGDLIYENYRWLNKRREVILEVAKNKDEMDAIVSHFESGIGRSFYEYLLNK